MYLTFQEYTSIGGTLNETAFTNFEYKARKEIDYYTQNRVKMLETIPDDVKYCVFNLISIESEFPLTDNISSFSNDGILVSFDTSQSKEEQKLLIIKIYCENWFWRGIDHDIA